MKIESMKQVLHYYVTRMRNRFWKYVDKTGSCWNWKRCLHRRGYGQFVLCGKLQTAHRVSWIIHHGRIPSGMHILHKCDNRACVNPEHLSLGTNADNVKDMITKKRHAFGISHGKARLTEQQVREIKNAKLSRKEPNKLTDQMLSEKYGVSRRNIRAIRWGQIWKHVI